MATELSFFSLFLEATIVVKIVIGLLIFFSILSWSIIIQRNSILNSSVKSAQKFEERFWSGEDLAKLHDGLSNHREPLTGNEQIFYVGFKEFMRLKQNSVDPEAIMQGSARAMNLALNREIELVEDKISFLGTIASISPYIGLLGTVWGIMHSFMGLSGAKQATLQMVAPGIAEALIATAIGLFVAIPAVMGYNSLTLKVSKLEQNYANFIDEFTAVLHRQAFGKK